MNIYRYKNCVIFNLWNYHLKWADKYPEIQMHGMCILNIITNQIRLWNREHWVNDTHFPLSEVLDISDELREHILDEVDKRARQSSSSSNPYGVWDINENDKLYPFIVENYVGNKDAKTTDLRNKYIEDMKCSYPTIDPYYFQRFARV